MSKTVEFLKNCPVSLDGVTVLRYEKGEVAALEDGLADMLIEANYAKVSRSKGKIETPEGQADK